MPKFLIDENLSPLLANHLRNLTYKAEAVREVGLKGKSDPEIIKWLQNNKWIIITSDLDFGEYFYWKTLGKIGVIVLKSKSQKLKSFIEIIDYLHKAGVLKSEIENSLVVAIKGKYRIRKFG